MSKFSKLRRDYINNWNIIIASNPSAYYFPLEKIVYDKIFNQHLDLFRPIKVNIPKDVDCDIKLSYLIDALSQIPRGMDIAFDFIWRGYEKSLQEKYAPSTNTTKNIKEEVLKYAIDSDVINVVNQVLTVVPLQTWEFVVKSIKENWDTSKTLNDQSGLIKRVLYVDDSANRQSNLINLFEEIKNQYFADYDAKKQRNAACFLRHYFNGQTMNIGGNSFSTNNKEKMIILFSCLLYEFRNSRTHAEAISPFKSSKATISTYMHCHLSFLVAYIGLLFTGMEKHGLKRADILVNVNYNIDLFKKFYGKAINK